MAGVPNPYFEPIILHSIPGKARFTAKAVDTNSNREIPPTIREVIEIRLIYYDADNSTQKHCESRNERWMKANIENKNRNSEFS